MRLYSTSASFTRPNNTTAYSQYDAVSNNTLAGNVTPMVFTVPVIGFLLTNVKLLISGTAARAVAGSQFLLHLYQFSPTSNAGDNAIYNTSESGYLGNVFLDCTTTSNALGIFFTDTFSTNKLVAISTVDPNNIPIFADTTASATSVTGGSIYGLLQSYGFPSYTPTANEVYTVTIIGVD